MSAWEEVKGGLWMTNVPAVLVSLLRLSLLLLLIFVSRGRRVLICFSGTTGLLLSLPCAVSVFLPGGRSFCVMRNGRHLNVLARRRRETQRIESRRDLGNWLVSFGKKDGVRSNGIEHTPTGVALRMFRLLHAKSDHETV
jgi:hypothetical protein